MMAAVIPRQITPLSPAEQQVCNFSRKCIQTINSCYVLGTTKLNRSTKISIVFTTKAGNLLNFLKRFTKHLLSGWRIIILVATD